MEDDILVTVDSALLEELDKKILSISLEIKLLVETNISIVQPSRKLIKRNSSFCSVYRNVTDNKRSLKENF